MTNEIRISGLGQVSAAGSGVEKFKTALAENKSQPNQVRVVQTAQGEFQIPVYATEEIELPANVPDAVARRMSHISKMFFAAAAEALSDAFGETDKPNAERIGLVVGTAVGAMDLSNAFNVRLYREGPTGASPSLFASSVQNSIASHLSITFGIRGPAMTVMTMEQTVCGAFLTAQNWLQQNVTDHVLIVLGDEISEYHTYLVANMNQSQKLNPCSEECTTVVGEGAVAFVLSKNAKDLKKYPALSQVEMNQMTHDESCRIFFCTLGRSEEFADVKKLIKPAAQQQVLSHSEYYGGILTGLAFEVLTAVIKMTKDRAPTQCIQLSLQREIQAIKLIC